MDNRPGGTSVLVAGSWGRSRTSLGTRRSWHRAAAMASGTLRPRGPKNWDSSVGTQESGPGMGLERDRPAQIPTLLPVAPRAGTAMPGLGLISPGMEGMWRGAFPVPGCRCLSGCSAPSSAMQRARLGCCV